METLNNIFSTTTKGLVLAAMCGFLGFFLILTMGEACGMGPNQTHGISLFGGITVFVLYVVYCHNTRSRTSYLQREEKVEGQ